MRIKLDSNMGHSESVAGFKAVTLFSGAGGLDLGVHDAGFQILASVEMDKNCCDTQREWTKGSGTKVIEGDIRNVDAEMLRDELGLKEGELDLVCGGPPCQPFSLIGKRGCLTDERGLLLFEMVRFAKAFKPKAVLVEQVKGLLSAPDATGEKGSVLRSFVRQMESLGYSVKWSVMKAVEFGVPQKRERVFIVGVRDGAEFTFPAHTHSADADSTFGFFDLKPYATVGEALEGLPKARRKDQKALFPNHVDVTPDGDKNRIHGVPEGGYLANQFHLPITQRKKLHPKKDTTKYRRLAWSEPSLTLRCGEIFFHPKEDRYLTPREYLRIHGYPDWFVLQGPIRSRSGRVRDLDQHRQVANSVPPPLAKAVASQIAFAITSAPMPVCQKSTKSLVSR